MPDITSQTPRSDYTIAGKTFSIFAPYAEGHPLTANEASSMNQTFAENVRNNFAKRVKDAEADGSFDQDEFQSQLDTYMDAYEFGVRQGGGGRIGDPVQARAVELARGSVRKAIVKAGGALKDYNAAEITEQAKAAVASNPKFLEKARVQIEDEDELSLDGKVDSPSGKAKAPKAKAEATA